MTEHLAADALRALARQCLLAGFVGPRPPDWLRAALADGLGGVVLFASNVAGPDQLAALTAQLRAARPDVVIGMDEEGGEVTRLDATTGSAVPGAAALGRLDDPEATAGVYAALGSRLAAAGVTVDLAPVADVNANPRNPVIGVRSFGADPALVARHTAAAVRGLQSAGVAACAKHFPGHGDTAADSHHQVAAVDHRRDVLETVDLPPFRAAIDAGTRAVMSGHLLVPALDPDRLATLSPPILTGLLRGALGFTGTVVTDALEMQAVAGTVGMVEGAVQALIAGADALCLGAVEHVELLDEIPVAVVRAVEAGRLPAARVADAAARTTALGRMTPARPVAPVDVDTIAGRALQTVGMVRLGPAAPVVYEFRPPNGMATGDLDWSFGAQLRRLRPDTVLAPDPAALAGADAPVLVVRDPARHPDQRAALDRLRRHPDARIVDVGWPDPEPTGLPTVFTRGTAPALLAAAARLMCGEDVQ